MLSPIGSDLDQRVCYRQLGTTMKDALTDLFGFTLDNTADRGSPSET